MNNETLKKQLDEFLQIHYNGSFSRVACDYIHAMGMTEEEVEVLLEAIRKGMIVQNSSHACWRQAWLNL